MILAALRYILLPLRLIAMLITLIVLAIPFIFFLLVLGPEKTFIYMPLQRIWGEVTCFLMGISFKVEGLNNIPKDKGVVFLFTHASFADIPIVLAKTPGFFSFVAKAYVFKYPFFGAVGRITKTLKISKDREKSIEQYKLAEERLKKGESFMIAPEGTRSETEDINPFKSGPFIFAMSSHADLVPIVISGITDIWPKRNPFPNMKRLGGKVTVRFLKPISTLDFNDENRKVKAEEIRQYMLKELKSMQK